MFMYTFKKSSFYHYKCLFSASLFVLAVFVFLRGRRKGGKEGEEYAPIEWDKGRLKEAWRQTCKGKQGAMKEEEMMIVKEKVQGFVVAQCDVVSSQSRLALFIHVVTVSTSSVASGDNTDVVILVAWCCADCKWAEQQTEQLMELPRPRHVLRV